MNRNEQFATTNLHISLNMYVYIYP